MALVFNSVNTVWQNWILIDMQMQGCIQFTNKNFNVRRKFKQCPIKSTNFNIIAINRGNPSPQQNFSNSRPWNRTDWSQCQNYIHIKTFASKRVCYRNNWIKQNRIQIKQHVGDSEQSSRHINFNSLDNFTRLLTHFRLQFISDVLNVSFEGLLETWSFFKSAQIFQYSKMIWLRKNSISKAPDKWMKISKNKYLQKINLFLLNDRVDI